MRAPFSGRSECIDFQAYAAEPKVVPQALKHDDEFGIDIRAGEPECFDIDLVELPIAAALRPLVPKHRSDRKYPLRTVVEKVVLHGCANNAGGEFGAQRQFIAIETVGKAEHLLFNDVRHLANAAPKQ